MSYPNLMDQTAFIGLLGTKVSFVSAVMMAGLKTFGTLNTNLERIAFVGMFSIGVLGTIVWTGFEAYYSHVVFDKLVDRWRLVNSDIIETGFCLSVALFIVQSILLVFLAALFFPIAASFVPKIWILVFYVAMLLLLLFPLSVAEVCAIAIWWNRSTHEPK